MTRSIGLILTAPIYPQSGMGRMQPERPSITLPDSCTTRTLLTETSSSKIYTQKNYNNIHICTIVAYLIFNMIKNLQIFFVIV